MIRYVELVGVAKSLILFPSSPSHHIVWVLVPWVPLFPLSLGSHRPANQAAAPFQRLYGDYPLGIMQAVHTSFFDCSKNSKRKKYNDKFNSLYQCSIVKCIELNLPGNNC